MQKYFIVVTWAQVICQKCIPKVQGHSPRSAGIHFWQIMSAHVTADSFNANTSVITGFVIYAYLKDSIMVRQQVML